MRFYTSLLHLPTRTHIFSLKLNEDNITFTRPTAKDCKDQNEFLVLYVTRIEFDIFTTFTVDISAAADVFGFLDFLDN